MMKTKIVKDYLYDGLGFPIELTNVEMCFIENDWHPRIDVQKVADDVIKKLAIQETRLTGDQVRFIRSYFSMPLREFAEKVAHETHGAVQKWEKKGNKPTSMNSNTEHELRLYIIEMIHKKNQKSKSKFYDLYIATKRFFKSDYDDNSMAHGSI
jgi:DNA-binding transcriptional regulator YiaG